MADTGQSASVALAAAKAHLDKYQVFIVLHNQVYLAASASIVRSNMLHASFNQKQAGSLFCLPAAY